MQFVVAQHISTTLRCTFEVCLNFTENRSTKGTYKACAPVHLVLQMSHLQTKNKKRWSSWSVTLFKGSCSYMQTANTQHWKCGCYSSSLSLLPTTTPDNVFLNESTVVGGIGSSITWKTSLIIRQQDSNFRNQGLSSLIPHNTLISMKKQIAFVMDHLRELLYPPPQSIKWPSALSSDVWVFLKLFISFLWMSGHSVEQVLLCTLHNFLLKPNWNDTKEWNNLLCLSKVFPILK